MPTVQDACRSFQQQDPAHKRVKVHQSEQGLLFAFKGIMWRTSFAISAQNFQRIGGKGLGIPNPFSPLGTNLLVSSCLANRRRPSGGFTQILSPGSLARDDTSALMPRCPIKLEENLHWG